MSAFDKLPTAGQLWRNKKWGNIYTVLHLANSKVGTIDMTPTVVYIDRAGDLWARRLSEWYEKFDFIQPGEI